MTVTRALILAALGFIMMACGWIVLNLTDSVNYHVRWMKARGHVIGTSLFLVGGIMLCGCALWAGIVSS